MDLPHTHSDIEINFLSPGSNLNYLQGGRRHPFTGESVVVLWGGIPHQNIAPGHHGFGLWITLPLAWFLQWHLPNAMSERLLAGDIVAGRPLPGEADTLKRWLTDYDSGSKERRRALLLELEARLHRLALALPGRRKRSRGYDRDDGTGHIGSITRFMAEHYREPLSVRDIADAVRLNPKYLMRMFKKQCRLNVWEYLTRLRVSHAQRLLITTDLKVLDVALESGFASMAPFYAAFAAQSRGVRPLEYRRRHRFAPTV